MEKTRERGREKTKDADLTAAGEKGEIESEQYKTKDIGERLRDEEAGREK